MGSEREVMARARTAACTAFNQTHGVMEALDAALAAYFAALATTHRVVPVVASDAMCLSIIEQTEALEWSGFTIEDIRVLLAAMLAAAPPFPPEERGT